MQYSLNMPAALPASGLRVPLGVCESNRSGDFE